MRQRIRNQFLINYVLMFVISTMIALFAFLLLDFADDVISKTLVKNNYTAENLMKDDYREIDPTAVVDNGGGVQVIDSNYEIVFSEGLNTFEKNALDISEFTDFLIYSKSKGVPYSYDIEYNTQGKFWLIVTFPTSIRIDFAIVHNKDGTSQDMNKVSGVIAAVIIFYLMLLSISTVIYSKITSLSIVNPLKKMCAIARRLRDGDYSARAELDLDNEFGELQDIFNGMADTIEKEIYLRKQSEKNRKKLILDISHDLKNPLAGILGYAELCINSRDLSREELDSYTRIIYENSVRANDLITDLFQLSKMESPEFKLSRESMDICEYLRETMGRYIPLLDNAGFGYEFSIPEKEILACIDVKMMDRAFQNLMNNTLKYNPEGTKVTVELYEEEDSIVIIFGDDGVGMPQELAEDIFRPFVRTDSSRNSRTGGTGLGLAIVEKIVSSHGGIINLKTSQNQGCRFTISLPIGPGDG